MVTRKQDYSRFRVNNLITTNTKATELHADLLETGTKVIRECDGLVCFKPCTMPMCCTAWPHLYRRYMLRNCFTEASNRFLGLGSRQRYDGLRNWFDWCWFRWSRLRFVMNFDFFSGCRGPRFRDGGGRFALQVILPRGILDGGRFLPARLGLHRGFTFLGRCRRRGRFTRRFGRCGGHWEGSCRLGSVRNRSSRWPFGGAVE